MSPERVSLSPDRVDRFLMAWLQHAGALSVCLFVGGGAVHEVQQAGWIYTRGWHTAWVTSVLFLSYLAWKDVRREDARPASADVSAARE